MKVLIFVMVLFFSGNRCLAEAVNGRALQSPLESPPFPSGDWVGPILGAPDGTPDYPLQRALFGDALKGSGFKMYGWVNPSVNLSTSKNSNMPGAYDIVANSVQLNQAVLRLEKVLDTVQTDHIDWGFRLSTLFGTDYRYTTAKGWFSDQLLKNNHLYGYDFPEAYAMIYFPKVAQGMIVKIGRYISPPDIEAQLAPDNYLFTHSLMFTFDPFTFTGVVASIKLSANWTLLVGAHAGSDLAPWTDSSQLNGQALVRWASSDGNDSIWAGVNAIGGGQFRNEHDDLQMVVATWGHRFNSVFHMMTESYYAWQRDAALGGNCIDTPTVASFGGGGGCGTIIPGVSASFGVVNFFEMKLSASGYLSLRNDLFKDPQGQRSGFATWYTSHTLGYVHSFWSSLLLLRPELRYERSWLQGITPYDNGTRQDQFQFAMDMILRF